MTTATEVPGALTAVGVRTHALYALAPEANALDHSAKLWMRVPESSTSSTQLDGARAQHDWHTTGGPGGTGGEPWRNAEWAQHRNLRADWVARVISPAYGHCHRGARNTDGCGVRTHALTDWRLKPVP